MTPSGDVIVALCRLNSHARAWGCGKRAIYAYKTLAAALLAASGDVAVRLVYWIGDCGRCNGTGVWTSWGERHDGYACRGCTRGKATLRFVETKFVDGTVWHHPFDGGGGVDIAKVAGVAIWSYDRWKDAEGREVCWKPVTSNWTPRLPGERLNPDDAAAALNTIEAWLLTLDAPFHTEPYWLANTAKREMRGYSLDIGRIGLKCWYCDSREIAIGLRRMGPPFTWSAPVCKEHQNVNLAIWPAKSDLPEWVITPPLREWRERHERIGFEREALD